MGNSMSRVFYFCLCEVMVCFHLLSIIFSATMFARVLRKAISTFSILLKCS